MTDIVEKIREEALRLPADLAQEVYDFICFIEARHGVRAGSASHASSDWQGFFDRHARSLADSTPLSRDEAYADRLR